MGYELNDNYILFYIIPLISHYQLMMIMDITDNSIIWMNLIMTEPVKMSLE
jgi:hypothetical protein